MKGIVVVLLSIIIYSAAWADEADVVETRITSTSTGTYSFDVTVRHADTGWDHYANKWDIVGPDGAILGTRVLHHPHVSEQPFTRGLNDVKIPPGIDQVTIRAHDSVHGYGGREISIAVPNRPQ